eukprot:TRINITY_DN6103_c0_g1_i1.p1 TRINITY_DN6103_c0_g1~~TRINITY_DN6103_c0_g1_i1.p1  ORF type:complete len:204 (+),score=73.16 TRINITY_DN6103_c0_g1_i1:167-778(+)
MTILAELITAFWGVQFWLYPVVGGLTVGDVFWCGAAVFAFVGTAQCVWEVARRVRSVAAAAQAVSSVAPFAVFAAATVAWVAASPALLWRHAFLSYAVASAVFAYVQQRLLVQHLAKEATHAFYPVLAPYAAMAAHAVWACGGGGGEGAVVRAAWAMLCVAVVQEVFFGWAIIWQMTGFLNIRAFVITPRLVPPSPATNRAAH